MTHASWKQAIFISAAVAVLAIASVATLAWLRRPTAAAVPSARPRPAPLLYHDPTGSVYDLHLKMTQLEERLLSSERYSRRLEEEITHLRGEREAGEKERGAMEKRLAQMEKDLARLRRPPEKTTPAAESQNAPPPGSIEITPQGQETNTNGTDNTTSP